MHWTAWETALTTESEDRQIRSIWWNKEKTQTMTSSNKCTHEHTVLSTWNEREQSYVSNQLSNWQDSRLNTILHQWEVSFQKSERQEEWNV